MNIGCDSLATQTVIRRVLSDKEFEIYEDRLLEGALNLMSDVVICPRILCQAPVIVDADENSRYITYLEYLSRDQYKLVQTRSDIIFYRYPCDLLILLNLRVFDLLNIMKHKL